jgi:uncharacterized protein (DUF433 family)
LHQDGFAALPVAGITPTGPLRFGARWRSLVSMTNDRIEINPKVMLGKPVIRGTRIPVELIVRKLSEGARQQDLLDSYPRLTQADIHASLRYAADVISHEVVVLPTA